MLEDFINDFLINRKRYFRCIVAFIFAVLFVQYGFIKTIFIFIVSFIGYISGAPDLVKSLKKIYKNLE